MTMITNQEAGTFLMLFIRNGYVLNFTTNDFDVFTTNSIGEALCTKYGLSKGKSLNAYLNSASEENRLKLISDLFHYYEDNMEYEYNENYEDDLYWGSGISRYDERYARIYQKCKAIMDRLEGSSSVIAKTADNLKDKFSSEYMSQQIELMVSMQSTNPTNAIGMAKELIESCCKTILEDLGIAWSKTDDVPQLTSKTMDALNLLPANVQETDQGADAIKAVLGNLRAIPTKLAEIRNPFGSGHGKSASFQGLEERHAKLAVGSSITFVDFIWSTYENQKKTGTKVI
ncbi:MAG: abortive infection family protein [Ruminococcus sp.]|nr:abortive infection family protein [Ruminococcus sp.]